MDIKQLLKDYGSILCIVCSVVFTGYMTVDRLELRQLDILERLDRNQSSIRENTRKLIANSTDIDLLRQEIASLDERFRESQKYFRDEQSRQWLRILKNADKIQLGTTEIAVLQEQVNQMKAILQGLDRLK